MWAVLVYVEIQDQEAGRKMLEEQIVPMVKGSPGFVAGYWTDLGNNMGASMAIFDSEEHARAIAPEPGQMGPATIKNVQVAEVVASA